MAYFSITTHERRLFAVGAFLAPPLAAWSSLPDPPMTPDCHQNGCPERVEVQENSDRSIRKAI
jgi:hypothetical protein